MDWVHLEAIRRAEVETVLAVLGRHRVAPARLVEIGGGSGWQAQMLTKAGYDVTSFDVATTEYADQAVFPVARYDGHALPLPDASADIIYSSNVLEHIPHIEAFQKELLRVLKPGGIAVHLLPTSHWRIWTSVTHYPWVLQKVLARVTGRTADVVHSADHTAEPPSGAQVEQSPRSGLASLRSNLVPARHGEFGNVMTEVYYFSRGRWSDLFRRGGWEIVEYGNNGLAYTGNCVLATGLSTATRRRMARVMGSACHVFVLRPATDPASSPRR